MPSGIGGLLTNAIGGNLDPQAARLLAGQPINPMPGGAAPSPTGAPGPAPNGGGGQTPPPGAPAPGQAPSATYGPDPQNASTLDLLMKVHQQDIAAAGINRGLAGMAASFGTAQQQHDMMSNLDAMAGPADDRLKAYGQALLTNKEATEQQEHQRFMAGAAGLSSMLGVTPDVARELALSGRLPEILQTHQQQLGPTELQKNVETGAAAYAQSKGYGPDPTKWTPDQLADVNAWKGSIYQSAVGNLDPLQREMQQANMAWDRDPANKGKPKPAWLTSPIEFKAHQEVVGQAQTQLNEARGNASSNEAMIKQYEAIVERLAGNTDATTHAVQDSDWRTDANNFLARTPLGESTQVQQAKADLNTLYNDLYASNVPKGTRMAAIEADRLGKAMTGLMQKGLSADQIKIELVRVLNNARTAHANILAQGGGVLDSNYSGYANPMYFDANDPYHSGATLAPGAEAAGSMGIGATPTMKQVQLLRAHPEQSADFEAKFGRGTSKIFLGQ